MSKVDVKEFFNGAYDNVEFIVANGSSDYDVKSNQTGTFGGASSDVEEVLEVSIRTDQTITVKFNSTNDDSITVTSSDSPLVFENVISNIYISNVSGSSANVKILLK